MRNVTIVMDDDVARWVNIRAAERDTSVSRFIGDLLRERMTEDRRYEAAMQEYLSLTPRVLRKPGQAYPGRTDLHDR
jgi:hypothetical protein